MFGRLAVGCNTALLRSQGRNDMTLCPGAMAIGCRKCPIVGFCPLKSVIGDYKKEDEAKAAQAAEKSDK